MNFTPEQKKELEQEKNFILYLIKTKQALVMGNDICVGKSAPFTKLDELDPEYRKLLYDKYEDEQLLVLEFILYGQLLTEAIDQMDKNYYGAMSPIRTALQVVKKKLTPVIERDFNTVYKNGLKDKGDECNDLLKDLESQVKDMANFRVPAKVVLSKMIKAFNLENDTILATADRIIKKHDKNK